MKKILWLIAILAIVLVPNVLADTTLKDPHLVTFYFNVSGKAGGIAANGSNATLIGTCGNITISMDEEQKYSETFNCNQDFYRERNINTIRFFERRDTCNIEVVNLTKSIYALSDYNRQVAEEKGLISDILNDSILYRERAIDCEKQLISTITSLNKSREDIVNTYLPQKNELDNCKVDRASYISNVNNCDDDNKRLLSEKYNPVLWAIIAFVAGLFAHKLKNTRKIAGLGKRLE